LKEFSRLFLIRQELEAGLLNLTDLVSFYLKNIDANKHLNAFLEIFSEEANSEAKRIQKKIDDGTAGPLAGLVIGLKDNIVYKGHRVSASSKMLEGFESLFSATATERLLAADAIIIGRLNCDEFAMGGSNENSAFGPVLNPIDNSLVSGGSSGGSAVAVAANLCHAALGSDTGGSVRQPASFCGIYGVKPTYGRISRHGLIAYASSFDQIGTLTKSVEDAALILEVIAGNDEFDSTASSNPVMPYSTLIKPKKIYKIAYIRDVFEHEGLSKEVKVQIESLMGKLKKQGHVVEPVDFPFLEQIVPTYYVLTTAEASSNLSRYDGIDYGYRCKDAAGIENTFIKSRTQGFGIEVKRRIMLGTFVLSAGYYDAYYSKAQKVRRLIKNWTDETLEKFDFILSPTTPHPAFKLGALTKDPIAMYLEDIFTVHANLAGTPAISVPGLKNSKGLPFGIQVLGKSFDEEKLFSFVKLIDKINEL
jgi:aspartyl-tRNA(Asn)/glutamyl-tRNA(Gln) amidotransferase subunit A